MWKGISLATLALLAQGCATSFELDEVSGPALLFQSLSVAPREQPGLSHYSLEPGDIILTSAPTLKSIGIRLVTFSPVSHAALYVGEGRIVEALGSGVHARALEDLLLEENVALVLRRPGLSDEQKLAITDYALQKTGAGFNFVGATLHVPYSVTRRICEVPFLPVVLRDVCLRSIGVLNYVSATDSQLFCSQLVMQAFEHAQAQLTEADARLITPAGILHMREGDVASVRVSAQLQYVGHLKYDRVALVAHGL
jgi:hypothetical protein